MKDNTHPEYHEITVVHTDGSKHPMRTTWGKPGDVMHLDIDPLNHPAWHGGKGKVIEKGQLNKFEKRFAGFMAGSIPADDSKKK